MMFTRQRIVVCGIVCATLLVPAAARAQDGGRLAAAATAAAVKAGPAESTTGQQPQRRGLGPVAAGALIGAGVALAATAVAASTYGENERGEFCGSCMLQWSAITVPIGAGAGALVGYGIRRARPSVSAIPVLSPRGRGLLISARF